MTAQPPAAIPTIETERLILRGHCADDHTACTAMWSDAGMTRHIGGRPFTAEEVWARMLRHPGHWALRGFGFWAVEEKATGQFAGEAGFADFKRAIDPPLGDTPEAGWAFCPQAQGRGYATEAMRAALEWGDAHFTGAGTVCLIAPENAASLRVAQKCGFREAARATYRDDPTIILRRPPPQG